MLAHEAASASPRGEVWQRLMDPAAWWDGAHTFSGDASNLSMDSAAGSAWREDWEGGSVVHGEIMQVLDQRMLMLSAPFGPLAGTGARCIWTITLSDAEGGGTLITSTHRVVGAPGSGLDRLAIPVDQVMGNGISRLAATGD